MIQSVAFRNATGNLGFIQKNEDSVCYYVNTDIELYTVTGGDSWQSWVEQVDAGYLSGSKSEITKESIRYFLHRYAESISLDIVEMSVVDKPGSYYPRIDRERVDFDYVSEEFFQDVRAYKNIQIGLDQLFNYVEPSSANLPAYGHKIRELMILACTEVECLLVKALIENGYPRKERYTTADYVRCKEILGLDKFVASLIQYPALKSFTPFQGWKSDAPTKSLEWYNAYNCVKHNRSENIAYANLEHLLDSISAIHILLESQYGKDIFGRWTGMTEDRSIFKTVSRPKWACHEVCAPIFTGGYDIKATWSDRRQYCVDHKLPA